MALVLSGQDGSGGLSATGRFGAVGVHSAAPQQLASGSRWIGGQKAEIDNKLIGKCIEGTESGKIVDLNFHFKFIEQIDALTYYAANLRSLDMSSNNIRQIEGLQGMSKLKELKLYGCQITRIQGLEQCVSLAALHLEDNQITAVEGLDQLRLLEYLNLDKNRIQKLGRGLGRLTKLRELHCSQNHLRTLDGVAGLSSLEVFCASYNQLQEVTADQLRGLGKLDELRIAGNQLTGLNFLSGGSSGSTSSGPPLPALATLDVSANLLTTQALKNLPSLPQIIELILSDNHIEELPPAVVASCPSLEILDLSRNRVEKAEELAKLKDLMSLRELLLEGNPLASDPDGLRRGLAALDSLEYLDDKPLPTRPAASGDLAVEDLDTFSLTTTKALALGDTVGSLAGTSKAGGSRPSTGSSRPSTAASMKEAGIKDPLMHMRLKVSDRRYATEEQAAQWEKQTMSGLAAIDAQIQRTMKQAETDLTQMERYLQKAQKLFRKREELKAQGALAATLSTMAEEEEDRDKGAQTPEQPSRAARRLRAAVGVSRENLSLDDVLVSRPRQATAPPRTPIRTPTTPAAPVLPAACDEEIVDEDINERASADASPSGGDTEDASVDDEAPPPAPKLGVGGKPLLRGGPPEMRVDARAASRVALRTGSRGRVGSRGPRGTSPVAGWAR